jgi:hypothetical protein
MARLGFQRRWERSLLPQVSRVLEHENTPPFCFLKILSLPMILVYFEGIERGDLDPLLHR